MSRFVAILRGINVSGKNKIIMRELRTLLESIGLQNVETYIQSGNILFNYNKENVQFIIQKAILDKYGFDVPVIVRSKEQWEKSYNALPFDSSIDKSYCHITFLSDTPEGENTKKAIEANKSEEDTFTIVEKDIYLCCPNGYGKTKLNNSFFERYLKVTATTRNWKTVENIYTLLQKL